MGLGWGKQPDILIPIDWWSVSRLAQHVWMDCVKLELVQVEGRRLCYILFEGGVGIYPHMGVNLG